MWRRSREARPTSPALRIFFATDVHGSDRCFRKFLAAADHYHADVLILGGDIVGKGLVTIKRAGGALTVRLHGETLVVPAADEERLRADINRRGLYSIVVDDANGAEAESDAAVLDDAFRAAIEAQLATWGQLAIDRLDPRVRCIITPGNDDPLFIDQILGAAPRIEAPERELCEVGPLVVASLGDVTPTPWATDREYPEEVLAERIRALLDAVPHNRKLVLNFHCPPYGSGLDLAPELDGDLRPVVRGGHISVVAVGSKAVRAAIETHQPVVALHGHIHESRGVQRIGRTLCVNPGSDYNADLLRGVIVDFDEHGDCIDFLLTAG